MAGSRDPLSEAELLARGADCWDSGRFFDAHEEWESAWMPLRGTAEGNRRKGAICLAGAFVHLGAGRAEPARRLLLRSLELLIPAGESARDAAIGELRGRAEAALRDLAGGDLAEARRRAGRFPRGVLSTVGTNGASVG